MTGIGGRRLARRIGSGPALAALAAAALGCVPGLGPVRLGAVRGQVVDAASGSAVAGAEVVEWWRGAGRMGGPQPVQHARWATTDAAGAFALEPGVAWSPSLWLTRSYGPAYSIYHADYGLQHAGVRREVPLVLRLDRAAAAQGATELAAICRGEVRDAGSRRLAELACRERPTRNPDR